MKEGMRGGKQRGIAEVREIESRELEEVNERRSEKARESVQNRNMTIKWKK